MGRNLGGINLVWHASGKPEQLSRMKYAYPKVAWNPRGSQIACALPINMDGVELLIRPRSKRRSGPPMVRCRLKVSDSGVAAGDWH